MYFHCKPESARTKSRGSLIVCRHCYVLHTLEYILTHHIDLTFMCNDPIRGEGSGVQIVGDVEKYYW